MTALGDFTSAVLPASDLNLLGGAYTSWSPSYTTFSLGNGTAVTKYRQIGRTVHAVVSITLGSTSSVTGLIGISLPVTSDGLVHPVPVYILDSGTATFVGVALCATTTRVDVHAVNAAGTYNSTTATSATVPMTWTTSDAIHFDLVYTAAANGSG